MWDKLRQQIGVEREQLRYLLDSHGLLLARCAANKPDTIEVSALATVLHSFYTGVENIFKRIIVAADEELPRSPMWHRQLLEAMTQPGPRRPAVISAQTAQSLREYLDFRHVFRQAYTFQLQWEKMADMVHRCRATLAQLEAELNSFLARLEP